MIVVLKGRPSGSIEFGRLYNKDLPSIKITGD